MDLFKKRKDYIMKTAFWWKRCLALFLCAITLLGNTSVANAVDLEQELSNQELIDSLANVSLPIQDNPEVVDDYLIEANKHVLRLYDEESDLNTVVFLNKDATATMYYFADEVKYIDDNGLSQDKSNKLYSTYDITRVSGKYAYYNKDNDINVYLPKEIGNNDGTLLNYQDISIEVIPYTTSKTNINFQKGTVSEADSVTYNGAFGEDTVLRYTPTFTGFKEDIILNSKPQSNAFQFILNTNNKKAVYENGYVYIMNADGKIAAVMDPVYVYDSYEFSEKDTNGVGLHNTWNNITSLDLMDDGRYIVTILVSEDFLNSSETVYPVYVDPSINIVTSGSGTSKTIQDVPIYNGSGVNSSMMAGANTYNIVGYVGSMSGSDYGVGRTLVRFPGLFSNSTFKQMSSNAITNVTLYYYEGSGQSQKTYIYACPYTGSVWTESSANYSNTSWNGYGTSITSAYIGDYAQVTATFNLTSAVKSWKDSSVTADKGIMLRNSNETSSTYRKDFHSTESSAKPYISVTYRYCGSLPYSNDTRTTVNCHGYAMRRNDWPVLLSDSDKNFIKNTAKSLSEVADRADSAFQNWLEKNNYTFRTRNSATEDINTGEYRVCMRVGWTRNSQGQVEDYDYHFWYETKDGTWAHKPSYLPSVHLPDGVMPTSPYSSSNNGWAAWRPNGTHTTKNFYTSKIYYYAITT